VVVRIIRLWRARTRSIAERIRLLPAEVTGNVPREGRSRLHRRPAPSGAAGPLGLGRRRRFGSYRRRSRGMFQGRVGAGCTGDPRRQARQARWAWVAEGIRLLPGADQPCPRRG
jgi:hypothetical protein